MSPPADDQDAAKAIFREVVSLLEEAGLDYAVGGSLATHYWTGSSLPVGDLDFLIREEDGVGLLGVLEKRGFDTQEMVHSWLHKAFKDSVAIDLMFQLKNGTTLDDELIEHRSRVEMLGRLAYVMSAEDQVAVLAATIDRQTVGHHWYGVIDLMANNDLDWDYLASRVEENPLRALSVFYFALDERVPVEKSVLERMTDLL